MVPKMDFGFGNTKAFWMPAMMRRPLWPEAIRGLAVLNTSRARPPQPVRACASLAALVAVSHRTCWTKCENNFLGTDTEFSDAPTHCVWVSGSCSGLTVTMGVRCSAFHAVVSSRRAGASRSRCPSRRSGLHAEMPMRRAWPLTVHIAHVAHLAHAAHRQSARWCSARHCRRTKKAHLRFMVAGMRRLRGRRQVAQSTRTHSVEGA